MLRQGSIMPVVIPDDAIREAGLSDHEVLVEFSCHLFDVGKLTLPSAVRMAGLSRVAFEQELRARHIAIYRPTIQDLKDDLAAFEQLGI
jgi:predicted HTH domain antitoxin